MTRMQRGFRWLAIVGCGASLFQITTGFFPYNGVIGGNSSGCARFAANGLSTSIDFCYILDCDNGFFGGAIDPCTGDPATSLLVDCGTRGADPNDVNTTNTTNQQGTTGTGN